MVSGIGLKMWRVLTLGFLFCAIAVLGGCKKSSNTAEPTVVALAPVDINPDGTISDAGIQKIEAQAGAPNLTVAFVRTQLSDAGLLQLAKFPNLRHVEAIGSRVTPEGVEKLKGTIPEVEVAR
jgi:hypothetical protein